MTFNSEDMKGVLIMKVEDNGEKVPSKGMQNRSIWNSSGQANQLKNDEFAWRLEFLF